MPIKFKCSCGQVLSVPDKMAGKQGKCPKCKHRFVLEEPDEVELELAADGKLLELEINDDDDEDDDDDDDDDES